MKKESQESDMDTMEQTNTSEEALNDASDIEQGGVNILLEQIKELQEQLAEQKDATLRAHADLDNYRRRLMREKDEIKKKTTGDILEGILPTIDTMKLGLDTAIQQHPEAKAVIEGFQMVFNQFQSALEGLGITTINPENEAFDPHQHECIAHQPSEEVEVDHIMQVVRLGYKLNDRILRPASVIVSSGPQQNNQDQAESNE